MLVGTCWLLFLLRLVLLPLLPDVQVRFMISRPMVIDDNAGDAGEDEDLDLVEGAAGAAGQGAGGGAENATKGDSTAPTKKSKSVRMVAEGESGRGISLQLAHTVLNTNRDANCIKRGVLPCIHRRTARGVSVAAGHCQGCPLACVCLAACAQKMITVASLALLGLGRRAPVAAAQR